MTRATLGVAITTHGRPTFLAACLASVSAQTRRPDLVVVSQDGHDAGTAALVASFSRQLTIRHLRNSPPLGERANRRQAMRETCTDFVAMLDGDDEWEPGFLEVTYEALSAHGEVGFCSADHWLLDPQGCRLEAESDRCSKRFGRAKMTQGAYRDVLVRHLEKTSFSLNSTLFRRDALETIGFVPGGDVGTAPDYAIFLHLGAQDVAGWYLPERLGRYRVHGGQTTRNRLAMAKSAISVLDHLAACHTLDERARDLLRRRRCYHTLELAIAYAHLGGRREAVATLSQIKPASLLSRPHRLLVLAALLMGAESLRSTGLGKHASLPRQSQPTTEARSVGESTLRGPISGGARVNASTNQTTILPKP
jgi:glycosyltransferase involved in cell wall biosynthesis